MTDDKSFGERVNEKREENRQERDQDLVRRLYKNGRSGKFPYGRVEYLMPGHASPSSDSGYIRELDPKTSDEVPMVEIYPDTERIIRVPLESVARITYRPAPDADD